MRALQNTTQPDPLYVIFEEHLYNFEDSDSDRKTFILNIVTEYIRVLRRSNVTIPKPYEPYVIEELAHQVNTMLVKKIYGKLTIDEFRKTAPPERRKRARAQYRKISRLPRAAKAK